MMEEYAYRVYFLLAVVGLTTVLALAVILSSILETSAEGRSALERQPIQTKRAYNIAHRGDNGQLPEETAPAFLRAIEVGADFIEADITATKDGVLICFHDLTLDATTDVGNHTEFLDRKATYVDSHYTNWTGIFTVDLTYAEIMTLKTRQRYSFRDHSFDGIFPIITFEEYIAIAVSAPRVVGIYPEIKDPVFVNKHVKWPGGKNFEDIFLETLLKYGYTGEYLSKEWLVKPIFIQSYAISALVHASNFTDSPKVFLIDDETIHTEDTDLSYAEITSDEYLDYISQFVVGIGPWKDTIVRPAANNFLAAKTDLVEKAHYRSLQVHPYTFRNENEYLYFNFSQDPYQEYEFWINVMHIDGVFTDFCQSFHMYQEWTSPL